MTRLSSTIVGALGALSSVACGDPADWECSLAARGSNYLIVYNAASGNCGEQASVISRLDADAPLVAGCEREAADVASADQCTVERSTVCQSPACPTCTIRSVLRSWQASEDGSRIEGMMTMTVTGANDAKLCSGSYSVIAVRL